MKTKMKQLGQGMTEYIIIVALIAIAAIAVYGFFGDTIRGQMGAMTAELAGEDSSSAKGQVAKVTDINKASEKKTLKNFNDN